MNTGVGSADGSGWDLPSTGRRVAARLVDAGYALLALLVWAGLVSVVGGGPGMRLVGYLLLAGATIVVELRFSATPGQVTLGLQNVLVDGGEPSGPRTVAKYLVMGALGSLSFGVLWVVALLTAQPPLNRTWFDRWTGLVVVPRGSANQGMALPGLMSTYTAVPGTADAPAAGPMPTWAAPPPAAAAAPVPPPAAPPVRVDAAEPDVTLRVAPPDQVAVSVVPVPGSAVLDSGEVLRLDRAYVLGRDPVPPASHPQALPIRVADPTVSKTHLLVAPGADGAVVCDLNSTNGSVLAGPDGTTSRLAPGDQVPAAPGSTVRYGDRRLEVRP